MRQGVFVAILHELGESSLSNAINFDHNIDAFANQTAHDAGLGTLRCPSDEAIVGRRTWYPHTDLDIPEGQFRLSHASYAMCARTCYHSTRDLPRLRLLTQGDKGIGYVKSSVRLADIRDGTGTTIPFGERVLGRLNEGARVLTHWWVDG